MPLKKVWDTEDTFHYEEEHGDHEQDRGHGVSPLSGEHYSNRAQRERETHDNRHAMDEPW